MEFPDFFCKYTPIPRVLDQDNALVNRLIELAPRVGRKYTTVDVKVQKLEMGQTTCIPGWHCDTISDPEASHSLLVIGHNRTEFKIDDNIVILPEWTFAQYGSDQLHRGPVVTKAETRFLFRLTESDTLRGCARIHDKYPHTFG